MKISRVLSGTALAAIASAGLGSEVANAQGTGTPGTSGEAIQASPGAEFGEILVTARRKSENLRDVPASVSVLTSDALERSRVRTGKEFTQLTSGVSIITGAINATDVQVNIRGINGVRDAPSNVAVVVDGIQKSNSAAIVQNQGALQQVEVLKGPQGALYGRNAIGGAFVLTTKKPGDSLEASTTASYGNNQSYRVAGFVSGPISENLGVSLSGDWAKTDGFYRNTFLPTALNQTLYPGNSTDASSVDSSKQWNVYGRAIWTSDQGTELDLKANYGRYIGDSINFNAVLNIPTLVQITGDPRFNEDINRHEFVYTSNIDPNNDQRTFEISLKGKHDFNFATLTAYVAYNYLKNLQNSDNPSGAAFGYFSAQPACATTGAALAGFPVAAPFGIGGGASLPPYSPTTCDGVLFEQHSQKDFSAEIRLASPANGTLQWVFGGYYLHINRRDCTITQLDTGSNRLGNACFSADPQTRTEAAVDNIYKTDVYAAFGSVDYEIAKSLKLGVALRYDREARTSESPIPADVRTLYIGNVLTGFPNGTPTQPANYYLNPGLDPAYNPSGVLAPRAATFEHLQPKISLAYKISPDFSAFANWGIGFKAGGFNADGATAIIENFFNATIDSGITINSNFRKETASSFEAGFKGRGLNGALNFDVAGYYTTDRNAQVFQFFVGPFGVLRVLENIDKVRIMGVEGSFDYRVTPSWKLYASANYTDSKIKANSTRPYTVGNKSPFTAEFTINAGSQVDFAVTDDLKFNGKADLRVTGPTYFSTVQNNTVPTIQGVPANFTNSRRNTYAIVNAQIGFEYKQMTLNLYANNLFNKRYISEAIVTPEFGGTFASPGDLRAYGVEVGFKF